MLEILAATTELEMHMIRLNSKTSVEEATEASWYFLFQMSVQ